MPKILPCELRIMSDIPSECVWSLKIGENWQETLVVWSETTLAAFEREGKSGCDFAQNPKTRTMAPSRTVDSRSQDRAGPQ